MMDNVITYAIHKETGRGVHVSAVPSGLECGCRCEKCDNDLIAAKGEKNTWHFRHATASTCPGSQETALHRAIKQIVAESGFIMTDRGRIEYCNAKVESQFGDIKPDVTAEWQGKNLFIEILVTHPVSVSTENFYKKGNYHSIEIDMKNIPRDILPDDLKNIVLYQTTNKREIYWLSTKVTNELTGSKLHSAILVGIVFAIGLFLVSLFANSNGNRKNTFYKLKY